MTCVSCAKRRKAAIEAREKAKRANQRVRAAALGAVISASEAVESITKLVSTKSKGEVGDGNERSSNGDGDADRPIG